MSVFALGAYRTRIKAAALARAGAERYAALFQGISDNAAIWTASRRIAQCEFRAPGGEACGGLLSRPLRRYACRVHREPRRAPASVAQGPREGMDHGRIRHAAALDRRAHAARVDTGQTVGPHPGNPEADRPLAQSGRQSDRAWRAPDHP